jgi:D-alanyl-D-alanine dipeptidase
MGLNFRAMSEQSAEPHDYHPPGYLPPGENQDELDRVPIEDNSEPLVDFEGLHPRLRLSPTHPVFEFPRVHVVRQSVARMLTAAAIALPDGLILQVVEGYRPIQVQRAMFRHALERATKDYPDWDKARLLLEAGRYSAPPEAITPPPHTTGGAVDVEIVTADGELLDFSSPYELLDMRQAAANASGLTETAQRNRALLRSILEPTGLTSYVDEWWHWSYGDNGWALRVGAPKAIYNRIQLPPDVHWVGDLTKLPS